MEGNGIKKKVKYIGIYRKKDTQLMIYAAVKKRKKKQKQIKQKRKV